MTRKEAPLDRTREGEAAFRTHLTLFLLAALSFLVLTLLGFYGVRGLLWPLFLWSWAVLFHAVSVFGRDASARVATLLREVMPGGAPARPASDPRRPDAAPGQPGPTAAARRPDEAEARVARLWRLARQIPSESARAQAFRVCVAADRVAEALAQDNADPQLVGWFIERHLAPTEALLDRYARVARRGVDGAESALKRVEDHDLPLLETRLDTLYQQLHRGDVVDLAVASEMLELDDLGERPPAPTRRRSP